MDQSAWPTLPLTEWKESKTNLHLYAQIVGKIRMALFPKQHHWWHVTLYPSPSGMTTGSIPCRQGMFSLEFNFREMQIELKTNWKQTDTLDLQQPNVAAFYAGVMAMLSKAGIAVDIYPRPYDMPFDTPFHQDTAQRPLDREAVQTWWRMLLRAAGALQTFSGRFYGKATPVQLFWHSFDLAYTRFSGRQAPAMEGGTAADQEAYSHEVISFGWWAGDDENPAPAMYGYVWPEPEGLSQTPLEPEGALWAERNGSSLAVYPWDVAIHQADPKGAILAFFESVWRQGADLAGWDREQLTTPWA